MFHQLFYNSIIKSPKTNTKRDFPSQFFLPWPSIQKNGWRSLPTLNQQTLYGWGVSPSGSRGEEICFWQSFFIFYKGVIWHWPLIQNIGSRSLQNFHPWALNGWSLSLSVPLENKKIHVCSRQGFYTERFHDRVLIGSRSLFIWPLLLGEVWAQLACLIKVKNLGKCMQSVFIIFYIDILCSLFSFYSVWYKIPVYKQLLDNLLLKNNW